MTKYELMYETVEIGYARFGAKYELGDIACCNVYKRDSYYPELVESFDTKEEALTELKNYNSRIWTQGGQLGNLLFAEEYWVVENVYDEDGEFDYGGEVIEIADLYEK